MHKKKISRAEFIVFFIFMNLLYLIISQSIQLYRYFNYAVTVSIIFFPGSQSFFF